MVKRYWMNLTLSSALAITFLASTSSALFGQGLETAASKDDWEEINFDFNSPVLTDGFPTLLQIADLLKANPTYKLIAEGHSDGIGTPKYNDKLGLQRAEAVAAFLMKYGASKSQIEVVSKGKTDPKVKGEKSYYSVTDEARWMNRRVRLTVMNGTEVIRPHPAEPLCCDRILKKLDKLDKLDEILAIVKDLKQQNIGLKTELDDLKKDHQKILEEVAKIQKCLNCDGTNRNNTGGNSGGNSGNNGNAGNNSGNNGQGQGGQGQGGTGQNGQGGPNGQNGKNPNALLDGKLALLGANVGADDLGHPSATARARYFSQVSSNTAIQAQGEYLYDHLHKEGQFDLGVVSRINQFQGGAFGSFKYVKLSEGVGVGLGQVSVTGDYLFKYGKAGIFGTKGFMDGGVTNESQVSLANGALAPNLFTQTYLRIVDQVGLSATVGITDHFYIEGNVGYLKSAGYADKPGGTLRFVFPYNDKIAFTAEGGLNETMIARGANSRFVVGIQLGNLLRPREFLSSGKPVPVDIPRIRYEVLTRTVQKGPMQPPVADAGPDQLAVPAGTISLSGANSYDPNGLPLSYQWTQEIGPAAALSNATGVTTTFTAAAAQQYTFRLTVTNSAKLSASARVRVTTVASDKPQILFFIANPSTITSGQSSTLQWQVINADTVMLGNQQVPATGSLAVSPTATTTYTLTATNKNGSASAPATVVVNKPDIRVLSCFITPATINKGESATLVYTTQGAQSVNIQPGIGSAPLNGSIAITPPSTTTYLVTATSSDGRTDTCSAAVTVTTQPSLPKIVTFTAMPNSIVQGASSTLNWSTENATSVSISTIGSVALNGSKSVSPNATITYILTASNATGSVTASAKVKVTAAAKIISFTATPAASPAPGTPVILRCNASASTNVDIEPNNGQGTTATSSATQVFPQKDTTYTCTATGNGTTDTQTLTVKVTQPTPPNNGGAPVIVIAGGPIITTNLRQIMLDASATTSPNGNLPLTFSWSVQANAASIQNANTATPTIQFSQFVGPYFFTVTVTDSKGQSSSQTIEVILVDQPLNGGPH